MRPATVLLCLLLTTTGFAQSADDWERVPLETHLRAHQLTSRCGHWLAAYGAAVYRSTDTGESWELVADEVAQVLVRAEGLVFVRRPVVGVLPGSHQQYRAEVYGYNCATNSFEVRLEIPYGATASGASHVTVSARGDRGVDVQYNRSHTGAGLVQVTRYSSADTYDWSVTYDWTNGFGALANPWPPVPAAVTAVSPDYLRQPDIDYRLLRADSTTSEPLPTTVGAVLRGDTLFYIDPNNVLQYRPLAGSLGQAVPLPVTDPRFFGPLGETAIYLATDAAIYTTSSPTDPDSYQLFAGAADWGGGALVATRTVGEALVVQTQTGESYALRADALPVPLRVELPRLRTLALGVDGLRGQYLPGEVLMYRGDSIWTAVEVTTAGPEVVWTARDATYRYTAHRYAGGSVGEDQFVLLRSASGQPTDTLSVDTGVDMHYRLSGGVLFVGGTGARYSLDRGDHFSPLTFPMANANEQTLPVLDAAGNWLLVRSQTLYLSNHTGTNWTDTGEPVHELLGEGTDIGLLYADPTTPGATYSRWNSTTQTTDDPVNLPYFRGNAHPLYDFHYAVGEGYHLLSTYYVDASHGQAYHYLLGPQLTEPIPSTLPFTRTFWELNTPVDLTHQLPGAYQFVYDQDYLYANADEGVYRFAPCTLSGTQVIERVINACMGEELFLDGQVYTDTYLHDTTYLNAAGCTVSLTAGVRFAAPGYVFDTIRIRQGHTYAGQVIVAPRTVDSVLDIPATSGCDSIRRTYVLPIVPTTVPGITLGPTLTADVTIIDIPLSNPGPTKTRVQIITQGGQTLYEAQLAPGSYELSLARYAAGMYVVRVGEMVFRVIRE